MLTYYGHTVRLLCNDLAHGTFRLTLGVPRRLALAAVWLFVAMSAFGDDANLVLENQHLRLAFDSATGAWTSFIDKQSGDELVSPMTTPVTVAPPSVPTNLETRSPPLTHHARTSAAAATQLQLTARAEQYEYSATFSLPADSAVVVRQFTVRNIGDKEQLFQTAVYATPPLSVGTEQVRIFPGSLPVGDTPAGSLTSGEALRPRSEEPLAILWDAKKQRGLGTWFACEEEFSPVSVERPGPEAAMIIRHTQQVIVRLAPGEAVTLGRQFFWLTHGSRDAALAGVQAVYRTIGLQAPTNGLPGLRSMVLYCGHPGGPPELDFRRYGGFRALAKYVPTLTKLHVDLLWLLPIWEHGEDPKWNLYSPFDHFQVSRLYGTADELKQLAGDCGDRGIRLMFDLVPHGPPDFTPVAKAHPEWAAQDQAGKAIYAWGQFAFDNHHAGWQDYMRRAAEWNARQFGAVGARVDCAAGGPLNWNRDVTNRPSLSSLAAGLGMNQAIREGYLRVHRQVCLIPEEYTGANIFHRVADLTYDAQFYYVQADLLARQASPEEWAREFQQFLHDQQQTLPPGALKMRWISNHDTVSWTFQKQRPAKAYGPDRMRALLAMCALIEGVPMLYQGDEDPAVYGQAGESSIEFLARIYGLRKSLPAIREGSADYATATATAGVFTCLREAQGQRALVLISFNPHPVVSQVTTNRELPGAWTDELSGERITGGATLSVAMQPYQVRVLVQ